MDPLKEANKILKEKEIKDVTTILHKTQVCHVFIAMPNEEPEQGEKVVTAVSLNGAEDLIINMLCNVMMNDKNMERIILAAAFTYVKHKPGGGNS